MFGLKAIVMEERERPSMPHHIQSRRLPGKKRDSEWVRSET